jgi:hypothetical protein
MRKSVYVGVLACLLTAIISCEKDFTDIGTNVISNTKFDTSSITLDVTTENSGVEKVPSDNITREPGQYLLGVFASPDYEKIEASIVSQVTINSGIKVVDDIYEADTTVVTNIDAVFIKLPYQATLQSTTSSGPDYKLDSIIGDETKAFNLNVYRSNTFINQYNPTDPTKGNSFFSNDEFEKTGTPLNETLDYQFIPNKNDTILVVERRLHDNTIYTKDTVKIVGSTSSTIPLPFARIHLDKVKFKELFLDKYESSEFESQIAFNDYFRGIILEATGNEGSLTSFDFNNSSADLKPSIEVYYTNTVLKSGTTVLDTISKNNSFPLSGFRVNTFKMEDKVYPSNNEIVIQGTAGSEAKINLFGPDADANGIADKIEELRANNWLINDASLTLYINQAKDITAVPYRLYLYKSDESNSIPVLSQITDTTTEVLFGGIDGALITEDNGNQKYTFKITDYISELLSGNTNYSPTLKIKAFNITDTPTSALDTIFRNYSWNPRAVTLLNESVSNNDKKAVLKISYSEKKTN